MNIRLLGPVAIDRGHGLHSVRSKKVRALLSVLALSSQVVVSFEELIEELWSSEALHNPRNSLHANALRLRKQLETAPPNGKSSDSQLLFTSGSGYVLDVPLSAVDAGQFERLATAGAQSIKERPHEAVALLEQATKLWRGPALSDVGDGLRCRAAATRLNERWVSAKIDLIEAKMEIGVRPGLIGDLTEMITRYPERERLSELLMLALYREDRQKEALDIFHRTRQWLIDELGSEPNRSLRSMYQSILVQDPLLLANQSHRNTAAAGRDL